MAIGPVEDADIQADSTRGINRIGKVSYGFNPLRTKLYLSNLKTQFVPRIKHSALVIKTDKLLMYRKVIAVCSDIYAKHINTLCGQNVELYIKIQSVPRSKHTPSQLYKPVS